jgi:hypothetical protein
MKSGRTGDPLAFETNPIETENALESDPGLFPWSDVGMDRGGSELSEGLGSPVINWMFPPGSTDIAPLVKDTDSWPEAPSRLRLYACCTRQVVRCGREERVIRTCK